MAKRGNGEIIWRMIYLIDARGDTAHAEPVVLLLADRKGWQHLASLFAEMANRKISDGLIACGDPDDHQHLSHRYGPANRLLNKALSHRFEFRLGLLHPKNRTQVLRKYRIARSPARMDLRQLFSELIRSAEKGVRKTNRLIREIAEKPEKFDKQFEAKFGMKLSQPRPARKKQK